MRLVGLDIGTNRIGVALSDETATIAGPLTSLDTTRSLEALTSEIATICDENHVEAIVVGLPVSLSGEEGGQSARLAKKIGDRLKAALDIRVIYWDERFTTAQAERAMIDARVRRGKRREVIDKVAAALILQSYLDSKDRDA